MEKLRASIRNRQHKKENLSSVDVAFCGLLRMPDLFKKSIDDLTKMRDEGIVNQILYCTWIGEVQKDPEIFSLLKEKNIILIETEEPKDRGVGNIWCQMKALDVALQSVHSDRFVLKTRTDAYIDSGFLRKMFTSPELFKIPKDLPKGNIFSHKVWVIWYEITRPFFMADECFYGVCSDVKKLVNYDSSYDTDFDLGPGTAHVRRFIHPFIKEYPILAESLGKESKDAKFRKRVQDFTEKVVDLRNIKLLRKLYEARRFRKLHRKMEDPRYIQLLATYYSILYSQFYIDGNSFPQQVIFRDSSLPSVKLDAINLDANFTKEKQRFPYGGQIYDYDSKLFTNIVEKKIEKTPFAEKIMSAVDDFYAGRIN